MIGYVKQFDSHDYRYIEIPKENNKLLYSSREKSMKVSFTIYADLESLLEKMNTCLKRTWNKNKQL